IRVYTKFRYVLFFFFQAEDGIRDSSVTGVQTCALPIWEAGLSASQIAAELGNVTRNAVIGKVHRLGLSGRAKSPATAAPRQRKRSEERRVGKECRSRGSRERYKQKKDE